MPLARGVESLNVATAAAVLGWELSRAADEGAAADAPDGDGGGAGA